MTQFNLLPDVKLEYLKAARYKKLVTGISVLVSLAAIVVSILLFSYSAIQANQIKSLSSDIKKQGSKISGSNINDLLTIQNQIGTLTNLHEQEPEVSNLDNYLNQLIPTAANIDTINIDFNQHTITMSGSADTLVTVNKLVDILKFATYSINGQSGSQPAFSNVVLQSFGIQNSQNNQAASYSLNFNFDPNLFNNTETIKLNVPNQATTRSEIDQPSILFKPNPIQQNSSSSGGKP